ncbi:hypothetical protein BC829DRAFT_367759 [Chytridium lagenaria]|nr:hypothetical protein BC829DRAFT_367759 [Chytridium lagenaria]
MSRQMERMLLRISRCSYFQQQASPNYLYRTQLTLSNLRRTTAPSFRLPKLSILPSRYSSSTSRETLHDISSHVDSIRKVLRIVRDQEDWDAMKVRLEELTSEAASESIWAEDAARAVSIQKEIARLENALSSYKGFESRAEEAFSVLELAKDEGDSELLNEVEEDLRELSKDLDKYSMQLMMSDPTDQFGCFLELHAGAGGTEACDWTSTMLRMYERWAQLQGYQVSIVDELRVEHDVHKSVTLQITGNYAYGWCKYESGVHRFVRLSKFSADGKRQTSFVSVKVFPFSSDGDGDASVVDVNPGDLKIEVMRSQGAGGQHVNKTESAVRITHLPSGIIVACQISRSQHQNKATAIQMLKARLYQRERVAQAQAKADSHAELPENAWGNQIRSYVMQPYQMVKDLRTGYERSDIANVLDGNVSEFMEAAVVHFKRKEKG